MDNPLHLAAIAALFYSVRAVIFRTKVGTSLSTYEKLAYGALVVGAAIFMAGSALESNPPAQIALSVFGVGSMAGSYLMLRFWSR